jgi:intein/homing endonuclease
MKKSSCEKLTLSKEDRLRLKNSKATGKRTRRSLHQGVVTNTITVKSVRKVTCDPIPVYDATVPKYHNYALDAGIFVHNTAKGARDKRYQELLPLRGKFLNAYKAPIEKLLASEEVLNILATMGFDPKAEDPYKSLRVNRLIALADADVDGPLGRHTPVKLCDGTTKTMEQLASMWEEAPDAPIWVWGVNKKRELVPARAYMPSVTTTSSSYMKITFDDGSVIRCTNGHAWPVNNLERSRTKKTHKGFNYCLAKNLVVGDSIPDVTFTFKNHDNYDGYKSYIAPDGSYRLLHRTVMQNVKSKQYAKYAAANTGVHGGAIHVHHKDENKLNNSPENLEFLSRYEHSRLHISAYAKEYNGSERHIQDLNRFWENNPQARVKAADRITAYNKSEAHRKVVSSMNADPEVKRKQALGSLARFFLGLKDAGVSFSKHAGYRFVTGNSYRGAEPSMSKFDISIADVTAFIKERGLKLSDGYKVLPVSQTAGKPYAKTKPSQEAALKKFLIHCKRTSLKYGVLNEEKYEEYRIGRFSRYPRWNLGKDIFKQEYGSFSTSLLKKKFQAVNHTVVAVEQVTSKTPRDFYCMAVPDTGNFLIEDKDGNGIVTGNCHINILILSLLQKLLPDLFAQKRVYYVKAPEYYATTKSGAVYGYTKEEVQAQLVALKATSAQISHIKGWGEINADMLKELAFNPETRRLVLIDSDMSGTEEEALSFLMSKDVSARKQLLGI